MDKNIQSRVATIVETLCGGNKSEFCRRIGRKPDAIKDIIGGAHNAPGYGLIYDILASDLGISAEWLILGVGNITKQEVTKEPVPSNNIHHNETVNINYGALKDIIVEAIKEAVR